MMEFQENEVEIRKIGEKIQRFFKREELEKLSSLYGFIKQERKLTVEAFVHLCIGSTIKTGHASSLSELCAELLKSNIEMCPQSLNEQFKASSVGFLQELFERLVLLKLKEGDCLKVLEMFSGVYARDSTKIELPEQLEGLFKGSGGDASTSSLKIDFYMDLKGATLKTFFRDGASSDAKMSYEKIQPSALYLSDLGYFKFDEFEKIDKQEGYYVSRLKLNTKVYKSKNKNAQPIDLQSIMNSLKVNEFVDMEVYIGVQKRLKTRLVLQKVPEEVAQAKKEKLLKSRKKKGEGISTQRLALCNCNAYITNLDKRLWSAVLVMQLYRIRWQIEIIFKVWKSILKLGNVPKMKPERFLCLMYGHLIWVVLNMKIFAYCKKVFWNEKKIEISELKGFKIMSVFGQILKQAIWKSDIDLWKQFFDYLMNCFLRLANKQIRINPNPLFHIKKFQT